MKKILTILVLLGTVAMSQTTQAIETVLIDLLVDGYKMKFQNDSLIAYTDCNRVGRPWNSFTAKEKKSMTAIYNKWQRTTKDFRITVANLTNLPVPDYTPPESKIHFYFVVSKSLAYTGAITGVLGLDSTRVDLSRYNINRTFLVYETFIPEADTTLIIKHYEAGNIMMPTWKYFTVDSLRNVLNTSPVWTRPE